MRYRTAFLGIDFQKDFTTPKGPNQKQGALYVNGAEEDVKRSSRFILNNIDEIDHIALTLDSHRVVDISHPTGWQDAQGNPIKGFTLISHQDMLDGKYTWTFDPAWAIEYTKRLEASGAFMHYIWPEHCIIGTDGHNIDPVLAEAVHAWERKRGGLIGAEYITKGSHPKTEHFGAFHAQVPIDNEPSTQPRITLLEKFLKYDNIYLAGEARSHCVCTSINQMLTLAPELAKKLIILEDCMSDVPNPAPDVDFSQNFQPIAERGRKMGMRFAKSTDPIGQLSAVPA